MRSTATRRATMLPTPHRTVEPRSAEIPIINHPRAPTSQPRCAPNAGPRAPRHAPLNGTSRAFALRRERRFAHRRVRTVLLGGPSAIDLGRSHGLELRDDSLHGATWAVKLSLGVAPVSRPRLGAGSRSEAEVMVGTRSAPAPAGNRCSVSSTTPYGAGMLVAVDAHSDPPARCARRRRFSAVASVSAGTGRPATCRRRRRGPRCGQRSSR